MNRIVAIIVFFLLIIVFGFLNLWPKYQGWTILDEEIVEKEAELKYQEEYFSNLGEISENLEEHVLTISKIDSAVPVGPSLPSLFNFFQQASSQSGLILTGISPSSTILFQENQDIQETHFSLVLSGSYSSFKEFLSILEESARLIEIDSINLSPNESIESFFSFNLRIRVYSY